jgi:hypothetical protein
MIGERRRRVAHRFLRRDDGAIAAEFAIAVPMFLIFLIGILEVARGCWTVNTLQNAVAHAARYATVSKPLASNCSSELASYETSVRDYLYAELAAILPSPPLPEVDELSCALGTPPTVTLRITATYNYSFFLGAFPINVVQRATVTTPLT